jgi:hypothetical protein
VHIELDERNIASIAETVDLASLDDQNVPCAGFEFLAVDHPEPTAFSHKLNFVVRMTVRPGTLAWKSIEEEHGDIDVAVLGADELV